jgi:hypothetical protein
LRACFALQLRYAVELKKHEAEKNVPPLDILGIVIWLVESSAKRMPEHKLRESRSSFPNYVVNV